MTKTCRHKFIKLSTFVAMVLLTVPAAFGSEQTDVRQTVERVFQQLKAHDYGGLYDVLPSSTKSRMSRDRFINALQRAQDIYELDRLEIGQIKVSGNLAVVDTVLYGRVVKPIQAEGKIVAQQYLVREDGHWRVATGDQGTVKKFLANNPGFSRGFKIRQPRVYVKQDGTWVEFTGPRSNQRRASLSQQQIFKGELGIIDTFRVFTMPDSVAGYFQRLTDCIEMKADDSRRQAD